MGTGLKEVELPVVKINFPISNSILDSLRSVTALLEFYGISTFEAEEIKEGILKLIRDFESMKKEGRVDVEIVPEKEKVMIEFLIKEDWIKKNLLLSFESKKIQIVKISRKGERIRIKIGVLKESSK